MGKQEGTVRGLQFRAIAALRRAARDRGAGERHRGRPTARASGDRADGRRHDPTRRPARSGDRASARGVRRAAPVAERRGHHADARGVMAAAHRRAALLQADATAATLGSVGATSSGVSRTRRTPIGDARRDQAPAWRRPAAALLAATLTLGVLAGTVCGQQRRRPALRDPDLDRDGQPAQGRPRPGPGRGRPARPTCPGSAVTPRPPATPRPPRPPSTAYSTHPRRGGVGDRWRSDRDRGPRRQCHAARHGPDRPRRARCPAAARPAIEHALASSTKALHDLEQPGSTPPWLERWPGSGPADSRRARDIRRCRGARRPRDAGWAGKPGRRAGQDAQAAAQRRQVDAAAGPDAETGSARPQGKPHTPCAVSPTIGSMLLSVIGAGPAYTDRPGATGASYLLRADGSSLLLDLGQGSFARLAGLVDPTEPRCDPHQPPPPRSLHRPRAAAPLPSL